MVTLEVLMFVGMGSDKCLRRIARNLREVQKEELKKFVFRVCITDLYACESMALLIFLFMLVRTHFHRSIRGTGNIVSSMGHGTWVMVSSKGHGS